ncbi:hypothetical protein HK097_006784 [Rhizophlyctis rosea]|uniref:Uncharacterized protein n=1 Tax=Rhizophlyctis rosea TaxID=64517 RepID=A0AAD5SIZ6_9FUNG|nr:hypothetical protein HK097_006784 [Rhizophlyctis rosea]
MGVKGSIVIACVHLQSKFTQAWRREDVLRRAVLKGHTTVVRLLLEVQAKFRDEDDSLLRQAAYHRHANIVNMLSEAGANGHASDDGALIKAAFGGHVRVVQTLLAAGAELSAKDFRAYRVAKDCRHTEIRGIFHDLVPVRGPIDVLMDRGLSAVRWQTAAEIVATGLMMHTPAGRPLYLWQVILDGFYQPV